MSIAVILSLNFIDVFAAGQYISVLPSALYTTPSADEYVLPPSATLTAVSFAGVACGVPVLETLTNISPNHVPSLPTVFSDAGRFSVSRAFMPLKAFAAMEVTPSGIVSSVTAVALLNAPEAISFTPEGTDTFVSLPL